MFRDRYLLVQQRLLRNELFCAPLVTTARKDYLQIATIDSLLGTSGRRALTSYHAHTSSENAEQASVQQLVYSFLAATNHFDSLLCPPPLDRRPPGVRCLLGILTQVEEKQYYLEDLTGTTTICVTLFTSSTFTRFTSATFERRKRLLRVHSSGRGVLATCTTHTHCHTKWNSVSTHPIFVMCCVLPGHVALDLSNATATPGIFTENAMVVVEGEVVNGLFRVVTIGFPPPEPRYHHANTSLERESLQTLSVERCSAAVWVETFQDPVAHQLYLCVYGRRSVGRCRSV